MISLYKDKNVNRKNASLIFTTYYCEELDLFNRQDNIWISKASDKVELYNMYSGYNVRSGLLKSKQFYCNAFNTAVDYETLMKMKNVTPYHARQIEKNSAVKTALNLFQGEVRVFVSVTDLVTS